jgi:15-cis-phytoene synthase
MQSLTNYGRETIATGSSSFAAAARLFDVRTRNHVRLLYAWCRHCDDVIDDQALGFASSTRAATPLEARLEQLVRHTRSAFAGRPPDEPAFQALARVIGDHPIPETLALQLLEGFAMDAGGQHYRTFDDTLRYGYHVAGTVGVMMAIVMGVRDDGVLDRACDLGIAFQLTNIARDVIEDARAGRCYLPEDWLQAAGVPPGRVDAPEHRDRVFALAGRLIGNAEPYYRSALVGVAALPFRAAWAVAAARSVYRDIGFRVLAGGPERLHRRAVTPGVAKLYRVMSGLGRAAVSRVPRKAVPGRGDLWTRPRIPLRG